MRKKTFCFCFLARLGAETRILDEATKRQRIRKHLEALERVLFLLFT